MADGTFAVLMLIAGLTDMGVNHCGTASGCVGAGDVAPRVAFSAGSSLERRADTGAEAYLRYDLSRTIGPFGQAIGLSLGEESGAWAGYGLTWGTGLGNSPFYTELHVMPGLYAASDSFDLGGPIEFRSGIELGYEADNGWRYALSYDHRSNAQIYDNNPGIETVQFRVSMPIR
ncbi:acyloxyacyl hydrolase [Citreicella sp. C3M06]|uniref:acyloxyacyl hydrolase n=1 Tax=Citreicella sp. C3M06 TaxID=2841564 RepID=UPI001C09FAD2|nr:acyloxyacyl hydrolase [Citreicella sp. C3M06]MBU2960177.1 acyloxyacyl hydrolase [Citreicella sp. C3M06]